MSWEGASSVACLCVTWFFGVAVVGFIIDLATEDEKGSQDS
jgi:hypothetical protein